MSANQWVPRLPIILLKNVASGEPSSIPWRAKSILADRQTIAEPLVCIFHYRTLLLQSRSIRTP